MGNSTNVSERPLRAVDGQLGDDGGVHGETSAPVPAVVPETGPARTAGDVALAYLREHFAELQRREQGVRAGEADSVHKMRVATRRLRSTMATYRPFLDTERWEVARRELKVIGSVLGGVRDLEVLEERLIADVDDLDPLLVIGPVRARIVLELHAERHDEQEALTEVLDSAGYRDLLVELADLLTGPPLTEKAERKPRRALRRVDRSLRRVGQALDLADAATEPGRRDRHLHEVRKAAKRARYAAESVEPMVGKRARRTVARMEEVQDTLGEHQDAVTARPVLRELGMRAYLARENGFTFGLLSGTEGGRADAARARFDDLRPSVRRATKGLT